MEKGGTIFTDIAAYARGERCTETERRIRAARQAKADKLARVILNGLKALAADSGVALADLNIHQIIRDLPEAARRDAERRAKLPYRSHPQGPGAAKEAASPITWAMVPQAILDLIAEEAEVEAMFDIFAAQANRRPWERGAR